MSTSAWAELSPLPATDMVANDITPAIPFDLDALKRNWRARVNAVKATGQVPIIDIESSFNTGKLEIRRFAEGMDELGVALIAYSHDTKRGWSDAAGRVVAVDPWRFIPATIGGTENFAEDPEGFVALLRQHVVRDNYPLMAEHEFRHYPSPRQVKRGELHRDVSVPIDGPAGEALFALSEQTEGSFQIHYEIEDGLLPPLEKMLAKHPKAKVIWAHLAQIRYAEHSRIYGPAYVRKLIETYPNLYFDVAFGGPNSVYPISNERHARIWDQNASGAQIQKEWLEVINDHPWRFLAAMDMGGDRQSPDKLVEYVQNLRQFLNQLPEPTRSIVAYKAAWKLLFNEEL
ncbi:MAG: amidohydrolase [Hydrogenophilaceae bacterium]|nr:amidohydrolase [Hydrogenophilaceae bacterium]